jgi:hypothetical protein
LGTVFSDELPVDNKLKIMEEEFNIPMDEELKEDLSEMCNLSQGIVERTTREVTKEVQSRINRLNVILINSGRFDDLKRAAVDEKFQNELLDELVPVTNS